MKKKILLILFIILLILLGISAYLSFSNCTFITNKTYGDSYYHTKVVGNVKVLNIFRNVKSISYCFTDSDECSDYTLYDGNINKGVISFSLEYPDSSEEEKLCLKVESSETFIKCSSKKYVVDSTSPVVNSLYSEIILDSVEDLESLFEVSSESGIKDFSCSYEDNTITCTAESNNGLTTTITKQVTESENNVLEGKSVLFAGDSITYASTKYDSFKGWSGRVGLSNYMDWYNSGVSGATIALTSRSHITDQIINNKDNTYDYIILQGGINDAGVGVELGTISDSYDVEDFDNTTFAGGLEELFYYAKKYNPDSIIGFIITYQTPGSKNHCDREEQVELTRQICEKWDIPYLDFYDGIVYENGTSTTYSELLKVNTGEYFYQSDPTQIHLNGLGYDVASKYITNWMKTL